MLNGALSKWTDGLEGSLDYTWLECRPDLDMVMGVGCVDAFWVYSIVEF
jgi:hypothetical protein